MMAVHRARSVSLSDAGSTPSVSFSRRRYTSPRRNWCRFSQKLFRKTNMLVRGCAAVGMTRNVASANTMARRLDVICRLDTRAAGSVGEAVSALVLEHVEAGVPVAHEHQAVFLHEDVGRLRCQRDIRPRIDQLLRRRRHPRRNLLRPELIADVEHAHTGDV